MASSRESQGKQMKIKFDLASFFLQYFLLFTHQTRIHIFQTNMLVALLSMPIIHKSIENKN